MAQLELLCTACSWRTVYRPDAADSRFALAGESPEGVDPAELEELLAGAAPRWTCPECKTPGLQVRPYREERDDWEEAVRCEVCRKPIPTERLEAMPGVRRCLACQHEHESGALAAEPEYCPKCGAPLVLKASRGPGLTRYRLFCTGTPPCRL